MMQIHVRVVIVVAALARAASADPVAATDLGTPLPPPSAMPAFSGVGILGGLDVVDVDTFPSIRLSNGVTTPRRDAMFVGFSVATYMASPRPGWFKFFTLRVTNTLSIGGNADASFTANGAVLHDGAVHYYSFGLPVPGYGYRTQRWIATAQLVPQIDWFTADFQQGMTTVSGSDVTLGIVAEVQGCMQYNLLGFSSKNSAACLYVAPVLYRDGWMQGASFGVRVTGM